MGVLGGGVRVYAGVGVVVGGLSVGATVFVDVTVAVLLTIGEGNATTIVGVGVPVGCARPTVWQEDNKTNNMQATTTFLSTFRVYHKISR